MKAIIDIHVKKCENGYYIRIWSKFWQLIPKRFIANTEEEVGLILSEFLSKET